MDSHGFFRRFSLRFAQGLWSFCFGIADFGSILRPPILSFEIRFFAGGRRRSMFAGANFSNGFRRQGHDSVTIGIIGRTDRASDGGWKAVALMVLDWGCVLFRIRLAASIFCFLFFLHPPTHSFARTEKKLEGPHYGLRRTGESQAPARFRRARTRMELGQATDPAEPNESCGSGTPLPEGHDNERFRGGNGIRMEISHARP
jgi:hypothetical protein